jgi:hypothetical protein
MDVTYGRGCYINGRRIYDGRIILGGHKLFLRDEAGQDIVDSYLPLDKIIAVGRRKDTVVIHVKPTLYFQYTALIRGDLKKIRELARELARRRGLKKKWLKDEWKEEPV